MLLLLLATDELSQRTAVPVVFLDGAAGDAAGEVVVEVGSGVGGRRGQGRMGRRGYGDHWTLRGKSLIFGKGAVD